MCEEMKGYFESIGQKIINGLKGNIEYSKLAPDIFKVLPPPPLWFKHFENSSLRFHIQTMFISSNNLNGLLWGHN